MYVSSGKNKVFQFKTEAAFEWKGPALCFNKMYPCRILFFSIQNSASSSTHTKLCRRKFKVFTFTTGVQFLIRGAFN